MTENVKKYMPLRTHYEAKAGEIAPRTIRFIGSDESIDRDGDTIAVDGWVTESYMKNPVVLFGHDYYKPPVAKTVSITIDRYARALMFDVYFPTIEELTSDMKTPSEEALKVDAIYHMAKMGLLNAVSVGFRGIEWEPTKTGRAYKKQELMEISIVPVPANPNAIAVLRAEGVEDTVIKGVMMPIEKSGRRLSAKSRAFVEEMRDEIKGCHERLKECHAKIEAFVSEDDMPEDDEPSEPEPLAPKAYFVLVEKDSGKATERT